MPNQDPSDYVELPTQAFSTIADAMTAASGRYLEYWKAVWQVAFRPYDLTAVDAAMRENLDRTNEIVGLSVGELSATSRHAVEFAEQLVAQSVKVQETYAKAMRSLLETGVSNLNFVKESADRGLGDLSKRFEHIQETASAAASRN